MALSDKQLSDLAKMLANTAEQEIDCATLHERLAGYVQAVQDRADLDRLMQEVAQHLSVCPECYEVLEALLKAEGLSVDEFRLD